MTTGILQFTKPSYTITENGVFVGDAIAVSRTGGTTGVASVKVSSTAASAKIPADIAAISITLTWAAGEGGTKLVPVSVVKDSIVEDEESIALRLTSIKGAKYAAVKTAQLIIVDKLQELITTPTDETIIAVVSDQYTGVKVKDLKAFMGITPNPNPNPDPNPNPNPNPNPTPNPNPNPTPTPNPTPNPNPNVDPYLNSVVLLLKGNGTNNAIISDNSSFNHLIMNQNGIINAINPKKYGLGSLVFSGANQLILDSDFVSNFEPFAFSKKTIDSLIRITEPATGWVSGIIGNYKAVAANGRWRMGYTTSSLSIDNPTLSLHFTWTTSTGSENELVFTQPYVNDFNHLAVCVDSTTPEQTIIYLCINGVVKAFNNNNFVSQTTLFNAHTIGGGMDYTTSIKAHVNVLRLTKNVRYTGNFNVETDTYLN